MSSINDTISSTAAASPFVGGVVASASVQSGILSTLNQSSTSQSAGLTGLIAAANSAASLAPAANYTPSADLMAAITAASKASTSTSGGALIQAVTSQANTASALLNGLGGSFSGIG